MKVKSLKKFKFFFEIIRFFHKKYLRVYNSLFKQKFNSVILSLLKRKIEINTIYDIGACQGEWTKIISETCLKNKEFILFEANKEHEDHLKKTGHKYFLNLLSDKEKEVKFYSTASSGDSYYIEKSIYYGKSLSPKIMQTSTLDILQKKNDLPYPDFIKIDTQGSEIDILSGGNETLKKCKIVLLECPIVSYNDGAPNLDEYIKYLDKIGYLPIEICDIHHMDKVLVQIDIMFLKKDIFNKIYTDKKVLNLFK